MAVASDFDEAVTKGFTASGTYRSLLLRVGRDRTGQPRSWPNCGLTTRGGSIMIALGGLTQDVPKLLDTILEDAVNVLTGRRQLPAALTLVGASLGQGQSRALAARRGSVEPAYFHASAGERLAPLELWRQRFPDDAGDRGRPYRPVARLPPVDHPDTVAHRREFA